MTVEMLIFFSVHADAAAGGDEDVLVVEGIVQVRQSGIRF
jgi:hypothetical protein